MSPTLSAISDKPGAGSVTPAPSWILREYGMAGKYRLFGKLGFVFLLVLLAAWKAEVDPVMFFTNLPYGLEKGKDLFVPDLTAFPELLQPAMVTILLAAVPTPLGILLAIPIAFLASRNLFPQWIRLPVRILITLKRGMPEFVTMVLLAAAFGLGPYPGICAIALGSVGMLSKLFADAIEEVDKKHLESVECTGATHSQVIRYAVLPQVMPVIVANSIFRFEINMRQAGLLGAVGAGGLGYELSASLSALEYGRAMSVILMNLAIIFFAERVSDLIRKRLIEGDHLS